MKPTIVAHADWSISASKRWVAVARLQSDRTCLAQAPQQVEEPASLLARLRRDAGDEASVLVGFDFPIGLPAAYASTAGIGSFLDILPSLGKGEWADFYNVCQSSEQICPRRPFYPYRPGGTSQRRLADGLGAGSMDGLRRACDRAHGGRRAAAPLFWTMGAQQVGRAAISGWRDVLAPALLDTSFETVIWPFHGRLADLLRPGRVVVAETYPAEFYRHLGVSFLKGDGTRGSKTQRTDRQTQACPLDRWARATGVALDVECGQALQEGFGSDATGEDRFDALVGLFGMLNVVLGYRASGEPEDERVLRYEGWILGQDHHECTTPRPSS